MGQCINIPVQCHFLACNQSAGLFHFEYNIRLKCLVDWQFFAVDKAAVVYASVSAQLNVNRFGVSVMVKCKQ